MRPRPREPAWQAPRLSAELPAACCRRSRSARNRRPHGPGAQACRAARGRSRRPRARPPLAAQKGRWTSGRRSPRRARAAAPACGRARRPTHSRRTPQGRRRRRLCCARRTRHGHPQTRPTAAEGSPEAEPSAMARPWLPRVAAPEGSLEAEPTAMARPWPPRVAAPPRVGPQAAHRRRARRRWRCLGPCPSGRAAAVTAAYALLRAALAAA
mmetsp:Transcript_38550/g.114504  ORF Transcript_38550/g.114504 Transcript_38550/m.114504 type:complete len:212 (-) Transcript_38550:261-896(-)